MRDEREGAGHGVCEVEVRSIEEHSSVADAVRAERRIGDGGGLFAKRRKTEMFNGYEAQVGQLYAGMDLKKYY